MFGNGIILNEAMEELHYFSSSTTSSVLLIFSLTLTFLQEPSQQWGKWGVKGMAKNFEFYIYFKPHLDDELSLWTKVQS